MKYDEKGIYIKSPVSKESPCEICEATSENGHTSYCPNNKGTKRG